MINPPNFFSTVKYWYPLNILEQEGLGTTYEYLSKIPILDNIYKNAYFKQVIIAGLPGKYGFSLDLILCSYYFGIKKIIILESRKSKLEMLKKILEHLTITPYLKSIIKLQRVTQVQLSSPSYYRNHFSSEDFIINSEVIQNWSFTVIKNWMNNLPTNHIMLFVPNGENLAHMIISKLKSLNRVTLLSLIDRNKFSDINLGYADMPPFPPGLKRSLHSKVSLSNSSMKLSLINFLFKIWIRGEQRLFTLFLNNHAHLIYLHLKKN